MIEANFESRTHKNAAIAGVYQYDTGQRLRMRGLPTPDENWRKWTIFWSATR